MDALGLFCCSTVLGLFIAQSLIFTTEKDFVDNGFDKHTIWVENYLRELVCKSVDGCKRIFFWHF